MNEQTAKPIAKGVVVFVDQRMNYGIIHASGYGRVLITHNFDSELIQLSNWISVEIERNTGPVLTFERTRCSFVDAGELERIDELLPTGTSVSKTGAVNLRIQTPVFIGNVSFGSSVGLSPHLGRVYLHETLCKKFNAKPLTWIHCGVVLAEPSELNCHSFWVARTVGREDSVDPKLSQCIRRCLGRFNSFKEKNVCILQLFDRHNNDEGYAYVHSLDFAHNVREQDLKNARAIQVYAAPQLLYFPEMPVPVCYARVVDDGTRNVQVKRTGELAALDISVTSEEINGEGTASNDVGKRNVTVCDRNCETIDFISRMLALQTVAKDIEKIDPDLFNDLRDFIAKYA